MNRADIHPDPLRGTRVTQVPVAVGLHQPLPAVIGPQRIAAGGAEIEAGVELCAGQGRIGAHSFNFGKQSARVKRAGAGGNQDMLAQHIAWPRPFGIAVQIMRPCRL